ncbi:MAG: RNA pseudouridine synthase [Candidatus Omnitrophota bacterium]|nr:RNA pseudouridine synthase [Candidatus Omnitrophota bacterium]
MIKTIYEDDYLLIVDKPSGLLTIPTPKKEFRTLTAILNEEAEKKEPNLRLYPCHRLDRQTSGLIIYAKTKRAQQAMMESFHRQKVYKEYIAFVRGKLKESSGRIKSYIRHDEREEPKLAVTDFEVANFFNGFSEIKVFPRTGRTNQIRIHFKQIGHPLLGERKFAFGRDFEVKFKRLALHSSRLTFDHPVTGKRLDIYSELPSDMERLKKKG